MRLLKAGEKGVDGVEEALDMGLVSYKRTKGGENGADRSNADVAAGFTGARVFGRELRASCCGIDARRRLEATDNLRSLMSRDRLRSPASICCLT